MLLLVGSRGRAAVSSGEALAEGEVMEGTRVTLRAEVEGGSAPFNFQWYRNGVVLPGAVEPVLVFAAIRPDEAGAYVVAVFNPYGMAVSVPEIVAVRAVARGRLANASMVIGGSDAFAVGFTLGGAGVEGSSSLLIRAAGPALAQLGVEGAMRDPMLWVRTDGRVVAANDSWEEAADVAKVAATVGAFPFAAASSDAALVVTLPRASYTAEVTDQTAAGGVVLVELYDVAAKDRTLAPRLINLSARARVGSGEGKLIAGFTVEGDGPVRLLVRGIGPALTGFGIADAMADPRLVLFRNTDVVGENDTWNAASSEGVAPPSSAVAAAANAVGAFALPAQSTDAALVVTLPPGSYTAQLMSTNGAGGVALLEIYEVP